LNSRGFYDFKLNTYLWYHPAKVVHLVTFLSQDMLKGQEFQEHLRRRLSIILNKVTQFFHNPAFAQRKS
jgi:hypothetical protein